MKVIQHSNQLIPYRLIDGAWPERNEGEWDQGRCKHELPKPVVAEVPQTGPQEVRRRANAVAAVADAARSKRRA